MTPTPGWAPSWSAPRSWWPEPTAGALPEAGDLAALEGKTVVAGVVSGRNIWRTDLNRAMDVLEQLRQRLPEGTPITVATSTSLQHVPHDVERETVIDPEIRSWLAFADQKVEEVVTLARGIGTVSLGVAHKGRN